MEVLWLVFSLLLSVDEALSIIGCYECKSINGSDAYCHDSFNTTHPADLFYQRPCFTGREDRSGTFPGRYCLKVKGTSTSNPKLQVYIRDCVLEHMGNMCGLFLLEGMEMRGCIKTCRTDGCNGAMTSVRANFKLVLFTVIFGLALVFGR